MRPQPVFPRNSGTAHPASNAVSRPSPIFSFCSKVDGLGLAAGVEVCPADGHDFQEPTVSLNCMRAVYQGRSSCGAKSKELILKGLQYHRDMQ